MGRVAQESVLRVEQIASDLQHPGPARVDADARDLHSTGHQLDDEGVRLFPSGATLPKPVGC
jgi:hypothetical protein